MFGFLYTVSYRLPTMSKPPTSGSRWRAPWRDPCQTLPEWLNNYKVMDALYAQMAPRTPAVEDKICEKKQEFRKYYQDLCISFIVNLNGWQLQNHWIVAATVVPAASFGQSFAVSDCGLHPVSAHSHCMLLLGCRYVVAADALSRGCSQASTHNANL